VDSGTLSCEGAGGVGAVYLTSQNGTKYAVNGIARSRADAADIYDIWTSGVNIGPLIDQGLLLCD
jgi:hypothetical protein